MKNTAKIILTLSIITLLIFLIPKLIMPGKTIENSHIYTKAICNDSNYCEDYLIECNENKPPKLTPTGFSVQQLKNWKDPRKNLSKENLCE